MLSSLAAERYSGVFVVSAIAADPAALAAAAAFARQVNCEVERISEAVDGATFRRALDELSDAYRGEAIVAVAPSAMIREIVGAAGGKPVRLEIDSSGWTVTSSGAGS
jgi:hypothetical protein